MSPLIAALPLVLDMMGVPMPLYGNDWDMTDKLLFTLASGATIADYNQTRKIAANPSQYSEINPIMGKHPSPGKVNAYFGALGLGGYLAARNMPKKQRRTLMGLGAANELYWANHNRNIGLGSGFR